MNGDVVKMIQTYIKNTHGASHNNYTIELLDVFEIDRKGEKEKFKAFENVSSFVLNILNLASQSSIIMAWFSSYKLCRYFITRFKNSTT